MKFTPKINVSPIAVGILTMAMVGWSGSVKYVTPASAPVPIVPAVERISPAGPQAMPEGHLYLAHWYNSKSWWKRNAPIVGGAAGGGLIGGLAGGGKGALIGGAAGAGGGYLYKHYRDHHHNRNSAYRANHNSANRAVQPTPNQPAH